MTAVEKFTGFSLDFRSRERIVFILEIEKVCVKLVTQYVFLDANVRVLKTAFKRL